jgi:TetR/AcrR family transcriptional regulator, mexJK operon transcriptional repressor
MATKLREKSKLAPNVRQTRGSLALAKRAQIMQGAKQAFMEMGFDVASMDHIALLSGVSKATVYKHFVSKQELFIALIEDKCEALRANVFSFKDLRGEPKQVFSALGERFLKSVLQEEEMHFCRIIMAQSHKLPQIGKAFESAGPNLGSLALSQYLQRRCKQGVLKISNTTLAAHQFIALCDAGLQRRAQLEVEHADEKTIRSQTKAAVELFMRGYAP